MLSKPKNCAQCVKTMKCNHSVISCNMNKIFTSLTNKRKLTNLKQDQAYPRLAMKFFPTACQ